jgi:3-ketosteroid 9alpha-monooxygenase subunit A
VAVRFFGQDFALYRGRESGKVVLLDAYCPHMKTHLAAPNATSYVVIDGGGSNVEGDGIRCPYHGWRFGADGKCNHIPYHDGAIPAAAAVKSWKVVEQYGAIWVWFDPEGGEPDYDLPTFGDWHDETYVNGQWDYLGELNQHPMEVVDNIADYGHLSPIHGSTVARFENEFKGHNAIQRQCGGHRTLVGEGGQRRSAHRHLVPRPRHPGLQGQRHVQLLHDDHAYPHRGRQDQGLAQPAGQDCTWRPAHQGGRNRGQAVPGSQPPGLCPGLRSLVAEGALPEPAVHPQRRRLPQGPHLVQAVLQPRAKAAEYLDQCEGRYIPRGMVAYTQEAEEATA